MHVGLAKIFYRRLPYHQKRSFAQFVICVQSSLRQVTLSMSRRFSRKARTYMLGYHHQRTEGNGDVSVKVESSFEYNEKIHKLYKSHQDCSTADYAFISQVIKECIM